MFLRRALRKHSESEESEDETNEPDLDSPELEELSELLLETPNIREAAESALISIGVDGGNLLAQKDITKFAVCFGLEREQPEFGVLLPALIANMASAVLPAVGGVSAG